MAQEIVTSADKAEQVRNYAARTVGTSRYHRPRYGSDMLYTDGVEHLAETCGAHWLVDLIASHQPSIRFERPDHRYFQVWRLRLTSSSEGSRAWLAECWSDTPDDLGSLLLAQQLIPYSDFPSELSPYTGVWVEGSIILLSAEH